MAATEAILSGRDDPAFEAVFIGHYARVVAVLHRVVGDRAEAEELAGEVFARLYRQELAPARLHNPGGWLYRTATRLGIDALRAARRRQRYEQAAGAATQAAAPDDPLAAMLRAEQCRQVRTVLAKLKPARAQLLMLRAGGLSYKELAGVLDVKPTSVGSLLARAEAEFERVYRKLNPS